MAFMFGQIARTAIRLATNTTFVRRLGAVKLFVFAKHARVVRNGRMFNSMNTVVFVKITRDGKYLVTYVTGVRLFMCVKTSMSDQISRLAKGFVAQVTDIRVVGSTSTLVHGKVTVVTKCFVTSITFVCIFM